MTINIFNQNQWQRQGQVHPVVHQTVTNRGYWIPQGTILQMQPTFYPQAPHTQGWMNYNQTAPYISSATTFQRNSLDFEGTYNQPMVWSPSLRWMNVKETGKFIYNICVDKGWEEAYQYAANFKENEVTGKDLRELDNKMLKEGLNISNENHRKCLIETIKSGTDKGSIARSTYMGPSEDSTSRSVITWIPSSSMMASTAEIYLYHPGCIAETPRPVPMANGTTSFPMGPSAAVLMPGGFPMRGGVFLHGVPAPASCNEIQMAVDAPLPMPERTEYVDEGCKFDVETASNVTDEKRVEAPIRPSSKLGVPAQRQIAQEKRHKTKFIKLSLTFEGKDQRRGNPEEEKNAILTRFNKFGLTIKRFQDPDEKSKADYLLTFPDPKTARKAFDNQDRLRYKLEKWWFPRPSKKNLM